MATERKYNKAQSAGWMVGHDIKILSGRERRKWALRSSPG
jgi:hypothetical protein